MNDKQPTTPPLKTRIVYALGFLALFGILLAIIYYSAKEMDWVVICGSLSLGMLVGMLVGFFVQESKTWAHRELSAAVAALAVTGVLAILRFDAHQREIWFYPIGLVVGFIIGTVWGWKADDKSRKPRA
jgi:O-antigen/teichoic acid export membrane protein